MNEMPSNQSIAFPFNPFFKINYFRRGLTYRYV